MKNIKLKAIAHGQTFGEAVKNQATDDGTLMVALGLGLIQGLKYNGNFKRGLTTAAVIIGTYSAINGVVNVARNWKKINNMIDTEIEDSVLVNLK